MFKKLKLFDLNLRLFDGEAPPAGGEATVVNGAKGTQEVVPPVSGEKPKVVYGKQIDENGNETVDLAAEGNKKATNVKSDTDRTSEFEKLINGDYKDLFQKRVDSVINKRFAETKTLETKVKSLDPIVEALSQRYGEKDPTKLVEALMNDNSMWEDLADEAGLTVPQYKEFMKNQRASKELEAIRNDEQSRQMARQQYDNWQSQANEIRQEGIFPDFDLDTEAEANPKFVELLKAGIDVKTAFEVSHINDIKKATAMTVEKNVVNNIRANGNRPLENGIGSNKSGIVIKTDVAKFTREDHAEIRKRVANGEKIVL